MDGRYARQLDLEGFGVEGQRRLEAAAVLCVGAGGLGSPVATYLAAAGVGRIGLVDGDLVERSNLHRQPLHGESDVGRRKVDSARERLLEINPLVEVLTYPERLTAENGRRIAAGYDLIVDGADNFPTRYLCNDLAFFLGIPCVSGAVQQFEGQVGVFAPSLGGPCYRCLFPQPPAPGLVPSCAEAGVLGALPGVIGTLQAMEVIKILAGLGAPLIGGLLVYDALRARCRRIEVKNDPRCPLCGDSPEINDLIDYPAFCGLSSDAAMTSIAAADFLAKLEQEPGLAVLDVRTPEEWRQGHLDKASHIPMQEIPERMGEVPVERPLYVHCKAGVRSARVVEFLQENGFEGLVNVEGRVV